MARTPSSPRKRHVRFQLPLSRQNTVYSDSASSSSHRNDSNDDDVDMQDEIAIEQWLISEETLSPTPSTSQPSGPQSNPHFSVLSAPGPLGLQLFYGTLERFSLLSEPAPSPPAPKPVPPPPAVKPITQVYPDHFLNPDGTILSYQYSRRYFEDDEQEYVVPGTPGTNEAPVRIRITKNWREAKIAKQKEDELIIYRVPLEHMVMFGFKVSAHGLVGHSIRKPQDEVDDAVTVLRHGHVSWDIGYKNETWMLIGKSSTVVGDLVDRAAAVQPTILARMRRVKRLLWRHAMRRVHASWM